MPWMMVSEDGPGGAAIRRNKAVMDAHWAYELSIKDKILAAGSLRSDDGVTAIGSLLVLDVATREEAMAIINAIEPSNEEMNHLVSPAIALVKANRVADAYAPLAEVVRSLTRRGVASVVLGCTEIPLGIQAGPCRIPRW